jgi:hypothetical protein
MTILEALSILEAATLECEKRNVNTPEVAQALALLESYIQPKWLIPQFRNHLDSERQPRVEREGQQRGLRATYPRIRDSVRDLIGKHVDALARDFAKTQDPKVKARLERWSLVHAKLKEPWILRVH